MKKLFIVAIVASFGMVSCKKYYTCNCTSSYNGQVYPATSHQLHGTKKKVTSDCNKGNQSSGGTTVVCEIQ